MDKLVFKFDESEQEYELDKSLDVVEDPKLIKVLGTENIRNEDSSLLIKSHNNLPIYDTVQIKINVAETGTFLVNYRKDELTEEARVKIINEIRKLKDKQSPTKERQSLKIKKLLTILAGSNPIYVTYQSKNDIKLSQEEMEKIYNESGADFRLLLLKAKPKEPKFKFLQELNKKSKFPLFTVDYLFVSIFSILFSYAFYVALYENAGGESIATFLFLLSVIFVGVLAYAHYSTIYKKNEERYKNLTYFLYVYSALGMTVGILASYLIAKNTIKLEVENIDYPMIARISIAVSTVVVVILPFLSKLINVILKKIKKNKESK